MHGLIIDHLAGEPQAFRVTIPAYFRLDEPGEIYRRLVTGDWTLADVVTVLRAALIGAGMPPADAARTSAIPLRETAHGAAVAASALAASMSDEGEEREDNGEGSHPKVTLGSIYATGFSIGLKPRDVDAMTLWEFGKCVDGWNDAHSAADTEAPSRNEIGNLVAKYG